jgi:ABC-type multidrug transport system ATPase subunit/pSer/pThr/pTyr-binding forkhead associated (FHA) protein
MDDALGRDRVTIGSAPDNDVVVSGSGVTPYHAVVMRQNGSLYFIDRGAGLSTAAGVPVAPRKPVPFDFRVSFAVGDATVPLAHPALARMLMSAGRVPVTAGQVVVGRDPARATLVITHAAVSGLHATVMIDQMTIVDHGSTSGTWVAGQAISPDHPTPLEPYGVVAFGPVPVPVSLLVQFAHGARGSSAPGGFQGHGVAASGDAPRNHRTVIGELSLDPLQANGVSIGRTSDNQIVVPHPQVSSKHAAIVQVGDELFLEDRGSANGTFVRGQRLTPGQRARVRSGEKVFIGPMPLLIQIGESRVDVVVEDQAHWVGRPLYEIEASNLVLDVPDRHDKGRKKVLLDRISFKALPGDLIALMGPSGAGKTTLLLALNGYLPPTSGQVRINGCDLYTIYDALRGSIGYVPQDDIVHPELTVFEAVKYSARFRLPPDYSEEEIVRRVDDTLRDLGLEGIRHLQIGKPEKKVLSGGQRKRVNIALELVTDPVILFLDEPTSGLAADDTTAIVNLLSDLARTTGKTIITTIHQPAKDEFEKFNVCLVMGYGGVAMYFGPTGAAAYGFFGSIASQGSEPHKAVDNPRDMFDMLRVREQLVLEGMRREDPGATRGDARLEAARAWRAEFFRADNPLVQKMYSARRALGAAAEARGVPHRADAAILRQFGLLTSRYWKVKVRDRLGAAIMFFQAPVIGVLLWLVFGAQKADSPYWCLGALQELSLRNGTRTTASTNLLTSMRPTTDHTAAMFFIVVSCIWFGTSNAAREIVTERAIYMRERMVNLGLFNYILSKYALLSVFCVAQCAALLGIVFVALGFDGGPSAFVSELGNLVALTMNATALGLAISALVTSAEAAMALTPILLIPQVVLGGLMVPMTTNPSLKPIMYAMPSRWGFEGAISSERAAAALLPAWNIDLHRPELTSPPDFITAGRFQCAVAQMASDSLTGAWGFTEWNIPWLPAAVLSAMTGFTLLVIVVALRRRDPV